MKRIWERFAVRIDSLNIRERTMLFVALVIAIVAFAYGVVFEGMVEQRKRLERQIQDDRKATATIQFQIEKMATEVPANPNDENRARLTKLTADADAAEEAVKTLQKGLVSPYQIEQVLEGVIDRQRGLRLIALRKLPLESVAVSKPAPQAPSDAKPAPAGGAAQASATAGGATPASAPSRSESIYKHGVQIVVEGQYFDMLNYLAALEKLPYQVFWGNARLEVRDYPNAKLTLDVFTLSLEKKWLSI